MPPQIAHSMFLLIGLELYLGSRISLCLIVIHQQIIRDGEFEWWGGVLALWGEEGNAFDGEGEVEGLLEVVAGVEYLGVLL